MLTMIEHTLTTSDLNHIKRITVFFLASVGEMLRAFKITNQAISLACVLAP